MSWFVLMTMATEWNRRRVYSFFRVGRLRTAVPFRYSWFVVMLFFFFFLYFFSYFSITFLALTINDSGVQAIPRFQWTISVSDDVSVFSEHQRCNSMSMRIIYSKTEQSRFLWWYTNVYINIMYIYIYKSSDILSNGMMRWSETLDYWSLCVFSYVRNNTRKTRTLRLYIYIYKIRKIFPS